MSYIRPGSSPECISIYENTSGQVEVWGGLDPPLSSPLTSGPWLLVPVGIFNRAIRAWAKLNQHNSMPRPVNVQGFGVREVCVFRDTGKYCPDSYADVTIPPRHETLVELRHKHRRVMLWRVTWEYIVCGVVHGVG